MRVVRYQRFRYGAAAMTFRVLYIFAIFAALVGCGIDSKSPSTTASQSAPPPPPPPPDVGDIGQFHSCKAKPRRPLSAREQCQIAKLTARCSAADDCLVSCISSPQGYQVGGGCSHVCFYGPHPGEPRPPEWSECDSLSQTR